MIATAAPADQPDQRGPWIPPYDRPEHVAYLRSCMIPPGYTVTFPARRYSDGQTTHCGTYKWFDDKQGIGFREIELTPPPPPTLLFSGTPEYQPSPFDSQEWNGRMKRWGWLNKAA